METVVSAAGEPMAMEHAIATALQMRREMLQALEQEFGPRHWADAPNSRPFTRAGAADGAETVGLGTVYFAGAYPEGQWRRAADLVAKVGERYGFTRLVIHSDQPTDLAFRGDGPAGGFYQFGMQVNTILTLGVGPHHWASEPYEELPDELR